MLDAQLVDRFGWTLIHSLWQIILVAYAVAVCNRIVFRKSASGRYVVGCVALLAMVLGPVVTFYNLTPIEAELAATTETLGATSGGVAAADNAAREARESSAEEAQSPDGTTATGDFRPAETPTSDVGLAPKAVRDMSATADRGADSPATLTLVAWQDRLTTWLRPAMSSIVLIWFIGVLLFSVRPLFGLYTVRRLRRIGRCDVPEQISMLVRRLCSRMGMEKTIEVAQSALLEVPAVVGTLRPLLLLPATAVTGLTPQQLEAVIAHELAHVRRHDYLVNLLQTIVETMLFYHPAVWWVSAAVRRERENCCDDIAVAVCNDRAAYAKTLVVLDELRASLPQPAVAANGGSLLQRIRRLVGSDEPRHSSTTWLAGAFLFIAMLTLAACCVTITPAAIANEDDDQPNVRLRLRDHDGKRLKKKMNWRSAYRGWRNVMPNASYTSDERGRLDIDLQPGKHAMVAGLRHNSTIVEFDVPADGLRSKLNLPPPTAPWPGGNGYPDLTVRTEVRGGKHLGEEFVVMTISNNKDVPYTLQPTDCTFTTTEIRVYPPKSQQQTGVVIPPKGKGEKVISVAWHEYVQDGIWTSRNESIDEKWPVTEPKPGKLWFRPNVGVTGSLPIQVTMPRVILDPRSFDPRTLKDYTGGLRGRFVIDGERPQSNRVRPFRRRTLDGREFELSDDLVLKDNEVFDESLVIGKEGGIANIVVWIRSKDVPVPLVDKQHVSLQVKGGRFDPHITLLRPGQDFSISNQEKFGVNFNVRTFRNAPVNKLLQANHTIAHRFESAEPLPLTVQCSIHPWMSGLLILRDNPFTAVSAADGTFELKGLPPGEWEFQFWHEQAGYLTRDGWPKGRVTINIDDETHDLGTIKLTEDELGVEPVATTDASADLPQPASVSEVKPKGKVLDSKHPIWRAVAALDKKQVLELLKDDPKLIDRPGEKGFMILHSTSTSGKEKQVELLLEVGADPDAKQTTFGGTPLQYAAHGGHLEVCKVLISHDASVDATDMFGRTPLMWAALYGKTEVAAFLIEHGADVNAQTTRASAGNQSGEGATALHLAMEKKQDEVVALLLKHGADRNLHNAAGLAPGETLAPKKPPVEKVAEDTWYRDAPYPEIGFAQPDEIDRTYVRLVSHLPAQRELGMTDTQSAVLRQLGTWAMQDFYEVKANDREGRQAVWAKAHKRAQGLLDDQQRQRLKQLFIQQRRTEVFMHPRLLPELKITDEQRAKIHANWQQHLKRIPKSNVRHAENARTGHMSYRQFWAEVREILTVQQRNKFEQLRGPPLAKVQTGVGIKPQFRPNGEGLSVSGGERRGKADVTHPGAEPALEKIGEVFGKPIYRHQIPAVDKDNAVRHQLHRLLVTPVMNRYREEHADKIELTDQEILAAIQFFDSRAAENGGNDAQWWRGVVSRDQKNAPRQLAAGEKALAEVDPNDTEKRKALERHVEIARKTVTHPGYSFLSFFLGNLKFQRHLYDEFGGGRVLFQQAGLEAFDAMHNWLVKHEKAGDFNVSDPELRAKLFEYWTRDHGAFLQGEKDKSDPDALTLKGIYASDQGQD